MSSPVLLDPVLLDPVLLDPVLRQQARLPPAAGSRSSDATAGAGSPKADPAVSVMDPKRTGVRLHLAGIRALDPSHAAIAEGSWYGSCPGPTCLGGFGDQSEAEGLDGGRRPRLDVELGEDVADVG